MHRRLCCQWIAGFQRRQYGVVFGKCCRPAIGRLEMAADAGR